MIEGAFQPRSPVRGEVPFFKECDVDQVRIKTSLAKKEASESLTITVGGVILTTIGVSLVILQSANGTKSYGNGITSIGFMLACTGLVKFTSAKVKEALISIDFIQGVY